MSALNVEMLMSFNIPQPFKYGVDFNVSSFIAIGLVYLITAIEEMCIRDRGTVTNMNGRYTIQAKKGETLLFQYIGYKPVSYTHLQSGRRHRSIRAQPY